jgi:acyl carrier protein
MTAQTVAPMRLIWPDESVRPINPHGPIWFQALDLAMRGTGQMPQNSGFRGDFPKSAAIELPAPLRYTGTRLTHGGKPGQNKHQSRRRAASGATAKLLSFRDLTMPSTFDTVANIIAETCDIPRDTIKPESHAIDDLGIDSLDFLDIAFAIDKAFGIKLPLEQWTQEVNDGKATTEQYFVLNNLCARIDGLVAAKGK